jgi:hypothetical protein
VKVDASVARFQRGTVLLVAAWGVWQYTQRSVPPFKAAAVALVLAVRRSCFEFVIGVAALAIWATIRTDTIAIITKIIVFVAAFFIFLPSFPYFCFTVSKFHSLFIMPLKIPPAFALLDRIFYSRILYFEFHNRMNHAMSFNTIISVIYRILGTPDRVVIGRMRHITHPLRDFNHSSTCCGT